MRHPQQLIVSVLALAGLALICSGCEREIARTEETTIKDDGTVQTKEKSVTEEADGDRTVTETETTHKPDNPD